MQQALHWGGRPRLLGGADGVGGPGREGPGTDAGWGPQGSGLGGAPGGQCVWGSFLEGVSRVGVMVWKSSSLESKFIQS